ncbi:MAG: PhoH family protein [Lachnospiraceae bacterium]|nr:PhoH family protein [Lachnospiraceae bacterium]MBP1585884.1 PhoH family protein [Lachnospiraceae bacterium]
MEEFSIKAELTGDEMRNIFGMRDAHIKKVESSMNVRVVSRNGYLYVYGDEENARKAMSVIMDLKDYSGKGNEIEEQSVNYAIEEASEDHEGALSETGTDVICHTAAGKPVLPKTLGQKAYVNSIRDKMITFGVGPAGTGKTYLAMAMAITAFKNEEVGRIILTRPAIEAGEKLGFLPGDLQSKVDPYLRPLYDALFQIMGPEKFNLNMEKGLIEVAPLAYMRGRTLDNAFIILDEAQNTTPAQMKMFLTRIGFGSKVVVTGDATQKDLAPGTVSGLDVAVKVLGGMDEIAFCRLTSKDVVRHPLVQKIVKRYEDYENKRSQDRKHR